MDKETHNKLQASINRRQEHHNVLSQTMQKLCVKLGDFVGYEHKKKTEYRIYVMTEDGREYDVDDLIEQTEQYEKKSASRTKKNQTKPNEIIKEKK